MSTSLYVFLPLLVISFMIAASQASEELETSYGFSKPFFIVYQSTSSLVVLYLGVFIYFRCHLQRQSPSSPHHAEPGEGLHAQLDRPDLSSFTQYVKSLTSYTPFQLLRLSVPFGALWMSSNYFFTLSLNYTSVAVALSLSQSSIIFVYLLSLKYLGERLDLLKLAGVCVCLCGVVCVSVGEYLSPDSASSVHRRLNKSQTIIEGQYAGVFGDLLCIFSAMCGSLYMILYPIYMRHSNLSINFLWLGSIGISTMAIYWTIELIVHFTGFEPLVPLTNITDSKFAEPSSTIVILSVCQALSAVAFNLFLNVGLLSLSPLFMKLVTVAAIPISFFINGLFFGVSYDAWRYAGSALIAGGFIGFTARQIKIKQAQARAQALMEDERDGRDGAAAADDGAVAVLAKSVNSPASAHDIEIDLKRPLI